MREQRLEDKSFQESDGALSTLFGMNRYSKHEAREIWLSGIRHGIEIGLYKSSLEGQRVELNNNTKNEAHKEFIKKLYVLCDEYKCSIQYHPQFGMVIVSH